MATHNWPLTLPRRFIAPSLRIGRKPGSIVTNPEVGAARTRRRTTGRVFLVSGEMILRENQIAPFEDFVDDTLAGGSLRFNWIDPREPPINYDLPSFVVGEYNVEMLYLGTNSPQRFRGAANIPPGAVITRMILEMYKAG